MLELLIFFVVLSTPIGIFICWKFGLKKYWQITTLGLCMYVLDAMAFAVATVISGEVQYTAAKGCIEILKITYAGVIMFAPIGIPLILLIAWAIHYMLNRKPSQPVSEEPAAQS